ETRPTVAAGQQVDSNGARGLKKLAGLREGRGPRLPAGPPCPALRPRWVDSASGTMAPLAGSVFTPQ
ncbi:hypothetical protein P7K49_018736, partial [Saguinus oedipus]